MDKNIIVKQGIVDLLTVNQLVGNSVITTTLKADRIQLKGIPNLEGAIMDLCTQVTVLRARIVALEKGDVQ